MFCEKGIEQANPLSLPPISLFPAQQIRIPDDLPTHEERGEKPGRTGE
jgi:hypothetical protein